MAFGSRLMMLYRQGRASYDEFRQDGGSMLSAALAYYMLFAMAPALILLSLVAFRLLGDTRPNGAMVVGLRELFGPELTAVIIRVVVTAARARADFAAGVVGVIVLAWGVVLLYLQLQNVFNRMWRVEVRPDADRRVLFLSRLRRFTVMLAPVGVLAVVAMASTLAGTLRSFALLGWLDVVVHLLSSPFAVAATAWVSFTVLFKVLPDARVPWRPAATTAAVAAIGWALGTYLFGLYLTVGGALAGYGAVGAAFVLLLWLNYSGRLILMCCKATKLWVEQRGRGVEPLPYAGILDVRFAPD